MLNIQLKNFESLSRAQKMARQAEIEKEVAIKFDAYLANPEVNMGPGKYGSVFKQIHMWLNNLSEATLFGDTKRSGNALRELRKIGREYAI